MFQNRHLVSYKCLKCDTIIPHRRKFGQHIRVNTEQKQITCVKMCPQDTGLSDYQRDLFLTDGRKRSKILCYTCGAVFGDRNSFLNHVETHGEVVEKKFVCEFCPYATHVQCYLKYHTDHKHPSAPRRRTHICELCGKAFYDKIVLDEHMKYTHLKKKQFLCDLCPKVFYRPGTLAKHKKCHSGKRPHVCVQCGQSFTVAYNLKVHERLHTGEKPYKCDQCDAAFPQKNSLDVHMRKHKKREGSSWTAGKGAKPSQGGGEGSKPHQAHTFSEYSGAVFPPYPVQSYPFFPSV